ncbi:MAG TPA: hypothetical protein VE129_16255, partial [Thermoanaerobaculia bacterium]|nr:hypothetical protein [Thermoanaerobaculia bacterium]
NRIVTAAYQRGKVIVQENRPSLDAIAAELLEKESLDGDEVYILIERITGREVPHATKARTQAALPPADPKTPAPAAGTKDDGAQTAPPGLVPAPV